MLRALSVVGALVLLLLGSISGAQEVSTVNYKRYLTAMWFKSATDAELAEFARRVDYSSNQTMQIQLDVVDYYVTGNPLGFQTIWRSKHDEYTNNNIDQWMEFNDEHKLSFNGFNYPTAGAGAWATDGICYMLPGGSIHTVRNNGGELVKTTFTSYSFLHSAQGRIGNARVQNVTGTSNVQGEMTLGTTSQVSYNSSTLSQATSACYDRLDIHPFANAPYSNVLNKTAFIGQAYRSFGIAYYTSDTNPSFPFTYAGFTESDLIRECDETLCPGYKTIADGHVSTPGTPVASTPPCTKADGSTSGNPYDCAPKDSTVNCSIIDLPCNFKKAFIPRSDFMMNELPSMFTKEWNLPTQVTDKITFSIPFLGSNIDMGFDFGDWAMNDTFKGVVKLICAFSALYWLLNFFGIPNILGGSVKGNSDLADGVNKARYKWNQRGRK